MEHIMKLNPTPFSMIKSGKKTIELRLYDEKRQKVRTGDTILFVHAENPDEKIRAKVSALYRHDSFEDLYQELPLSECGYTEDDILKASPSDMEKYYSAEMQKEYGVIGIRIAVI